MYEKKIKLKNNEIAAKINAETGDITELPFKIKKDNRNKNRSWFNNQQRFQRRFEKAWAILKERTSKQEYRVARELEDLARAYTSSLEPLNDETSVRELSRILGEDRRVIKKILVKLFDEGVYGKFAVTDKEYNVQRYWIFNPHLSFNGTHIDSNILNLFKDTRFAPNNIE